MSSQKHQADDDSDEQFKRYCDNHQCKTLREVKIIHPTEEDYYGNQGSIILCKACGQGLGHAVWWSQPPGV